MATVVRFPGPKPDYRLFDPPLVVAPSPEDVNELVSLEISKATMAKYIDAQLKIPIFQAWAHLAGVLPPIPNCFKMAVDMPGCIPRSIADAHACYKGVRRPYGTEDAGDDVAVYVISTQYTVGWSGTKDRMACVGAIVGAPEGAVMTVQVRPASALHPTQGDVWGTITKWEFVGGSTEHPDLPIDFDERYNERLWHR